MNNYRHKIEQTVPRTVLKALRLLQKRNPDKIVVVMIYENLSSQKRTRTYIPRGWPRIRCATIKHLGHGRASDDREFFSVSKFVDFPLFVLSNQLNMSYNEAVAKRF